MSTGKKTALTKAEVESRREVVRAIARSHENGTLATVKTGRRTVRNNEPSGVLGELTLVIAICDNLDPREAREVLSVAMTRYEP
jgi:hypothetical protein